MIQQKTLEEKVKSLEKRLGKYNARIPGRYFNAKWAKLLGNAYPLLGIILVACEWDKGIWRGNIEEIAVVAGRCDRTIRGWLKRLEKIDGFRVTHFPYSLRICLPDDLVPDPPKEIGTSKDLRRQYDDISPAVSKGVVGKNSVNHYQLQQMKNGLVNKFNMTAR